MEVPAENAQIKNFASILLYFNVRKRKSSRKSFPYVIDTWEKIHCTMYKIVDMNEKIIKH